MSGICRLLVLYKERSGLPHEEPAANKAWRRCSGPYTLVEYPNQVNYDPDTTVNASGTWVADPNPYGSEPNGFGIHANGNNSAC
jgi:hypothetical protein